MSGVKHRFFKPENNPTSVYDALYGRTFQLTNWKEADKLLRTLQQLQEEIENAERSKCEEHRDET